MMPLLFKGGAVFLVHLVIEHLETTVRNEYLWYTNTLWGLVVLDDSCNDTWQSKG